MKSRPPRWIERSDGIVEIEGDLTFSTAFQFYQETLGYFTCRKKIEIDLNKIEKIDSLGLALLIEWLKIAQKRGIVLNYRHFRQNVRKMVELYDLDAILPAENA